MNGKRILLMTVVIALAAGSAAAMTVDEAKAFMTASRSRFLSAKSYHIEYTTTAMGIPTESLKVVVSKLEMNAKVEDSYFTLPKGCKVIDVKSAAEVAKALAGSLLSASKAK